MGRFVQPAGPSLDYSSPGDWFRAVRCLDVALHRGRVDESHGRVANFLDAWESANGGPPHRAPGAGGRMSTWLVQVAAGRGQFPAVVGESKLSDHAVRPSPPVADLADYRDL
ncbi:hypothetical protein BST10_02430 [Mycolicibacter algericus DSM 45454]|uniref:Uncharacterized protein n=2 Tax=Mycolicibacter algericus TaxID=1288388 RepID=A0A7I9Y7I1_MYCAL|nr:hypothetical protein BST10_02430 [Mycolicibacter algericus DSM 45454]GFG84574.1 hypothetical protein MALGJ_12500 [Mycolicibacter algericus]